MKILEEFWYGNLHPGQRDMKPDSLMGRASRRSASCEEKLVPLLSDGAKVIFERLQANQRELLCISETEALVLGYKLGAKMTYEVMDGMEIPDIDDREPHS